MTTGLLKLSFYCLNYYFPCDLSLFKIPPFFHVTYSNLSNDQILIKARWKLMFQIGYSDNFDIGGQEKEWYCGRLKG